MAGRQPSKEVKHQSRNMDLKHKSHLSGEDVAMVVRLPISNAVCFSESAFFALCLFTGQEGGGGLIICETTNATHFAYTV
jgi:hypothetical protein